MKYTLLLLGWPEVWENAYWCSQTLSRGIFEEFSKLDHVNLLVERNDKRHEVELPHADITLIVDYHTQELLGEVLSGEIKKRTNARKLVSFFETIFPGADHSYIFDAAAATTKIWVEAAKTVLGMPAGHTTYISLPVNKALLTATTDENKIPGSIFFDYNREKIMPTGDLTEKIMDWITPIASRFSITQLCNSKEQIDNLRPFVQPFHRSPYAEYLRRTAAFERFVVTHWESYGYSVPDMAARGTEIIAPVDYLRPCLVEELKIPTFSNEEEFVEILNRPPKCEKKLDLCTDFKEIVQLMDRDFQNWLQE